MSGYTNRGPQDVAGSTGVVLPAAGAAMFASPSAGMWFWVLSA